MAIEGWAPLPFYRAGREEGEPDYDAAEEGQVGERPDYEVEGAPPGEWLNRQVEGEEPGFVRRDFNALGQEPSLIEKFCWSMISLPELRGFAGGAALILANRVVGTVSSYFVGDILGALAGGTASLMVGSGICLFSFASVQVHRLFSNSGRDEIPVRHLIGMGAALALMGVNRTDMIGVFVAVSGVSATM